MYVFALIFHFFCILTGQPAPFQVPPVRQEFYNHYTMLRAYYRARLPC